MVVASLTMTSEREEVIDFVAPYFEQSGILIGKKTYRATLLHYYHYYTYVSVIFFFSSDEKTRPQTVSLQIHDGAQSGGVVEHRGSIDVNWHHDLDT